MLLSKEFREKCKDMGFTITAGKELVLGKRTDVRIKETSTGNQVKLGILNTISELDFGCYNDTSKYSPVFKNVLMELVDHVAPKYKAKMISFSFNVDSDYLVTQGFITKRETKGYTEWERLFTDSLIINGDIPVKLYDPEANFERINLNKSIVSVLQQAGIQDYKIKHLWFEIWVWWSSGDQLRLVDIYPSALGNFELTFYHNIKRQAENTEELLRFIEQLTITSNIEEIAI